MKKIMRRLLVGASAMALVIGLSSCGGENEPANEVASENDMNAMMADATNPFSQSEMAMDQAIGAAVGVNAADMWVRKMIKHHKGAVEMSRIVLAQSPTADVAMMAQQTIDKQSKEIEALQKLVATGSPDPASGALYASASSTMHQAMISATGADISQTYLRKMLAHHQGALAFSDVALANGATGAVRSQIEKTKADQQKEIAMVEAMLRGEPMMPMTKRAPTTNAAPEPDAATPSKPAAKAPTLTAAVPAKPKPAEPAPDPHAGHDMNNM